MKMIAGVVSAVPADVGRHQSISAMRHLSRRSIFAKEDVLYPMRVSSPSAQERIESSLVAYGGFGPVSGINYCVIREGHENAQ